MRRGGEVEPGDLAIVVREVAALLRAGLPPDLAWEPLLGTRALDPGRQLGQWAADQPGGRADSVVAAYRLSARMGVPPAGALEAAATHLEEVQALADARRAALAGPRASARVLSLLPLLGVGLGYLLGTNPLQFLLSGGWGSIALASGLALQAVGRWWSAALVRRAARWGDTAHLAVAELVAAALVAGAPILLALEASARSLPGGNPGVERAARALTAGATWAEAWRGADSVGAVLRDGLGPAWLHGLAPAGLVRARVARARALARRQALEAAGALSVRLLGPVGLCFLPSFMVLALVPVLVGLAEGLWR